MGLQLTDEQVELLLGELDRIIDGDRYFLSPRVQALREIRATGQITRPARPSAQGDIVGVDAECFARVGYWKGHSFPAWKTFWIKIGDLEIQR